MLTCTNGVSRNHISCDCGQRQTMNDIVDTCPSTKFQGGLSLLHEVDDDAVIWLESTATVALAKYIITRIFCDFIKSLISRFYGNM